MTEHSYLQLRLYDNEWTAIENLLKGRYPSNRVAPYAESKYQYVRWYLNRELPVLARRNEGQTCSGIGKIEIKRLGFWIPNGVMQDVSQLACRHNMPISKFVVKALLNPLALECLHNRFELFGE